MQLIMNEVSFPIERLLTKLLTQSKAIQSFQKRFNNYIKPLVKL